MKIAEIEAIALAVPFDEKIAAPIRLFFHQSSIGCVSPPKIAPAAPEGAANATIIISYSGIDVKQILRGECGTSFCARTLDGWSERHPLASLQSQTE